MNNTCTTGILTTRKKLVIFLTSLAISPITQADIFTGEIRRVAIFVAVMGASNYTYVEACEGQDMMSWLNANAAA